MRRSLILIFFVAGCGSSKDGFSGTNSAQKDTSVPVSEAISVRPATAAECPGGGSIYSVYKDLNGDGKLDGDESPVSSQTVCNGVNGADGRDGGNGLASVFSMSRVDTGLLACASGKGLQVNYGLDLNADRRLESSEISSAEVLCDGSDGAAGSAGPAGTNGHGMVFSVVAASADQCASGGSVVMMAVDANDNGVYSVYDPGQQAMVLCNGSDGAKGSDGQNAVLPAYTSVAPIFPCGETVSYKEVLMRLQNGLVLGSFSQDASGTMTRLAFIPDGTYVDTDGSGCEFSLQTSADAHARSVSWDGAVQSSWAYSP